LPVLYLLLVCAGAWAIAVYSWRRKITLATGAGWVLMTLLHGLLIKPMFVLLDLPSPEVLDLVVFQKVDREQYWLWGPALLVVYGAFVMAMFFTGQYARAARSAPAGAPAREWFDLRVVALLTAIAVAATAGFFIQFPQLLESANKNSIATTDVADYNSGGAWRALVELAYLASLCCLVNIGQRRSRKLSIFMFGLSALIWLGFCLLSDQRGAVLFSVVTYLMAYGRFIGKPPRRVVTFVLVILVGSILVKTVTRVQAEVGAQEDLAFAAANLVGQNLIENGKTISIIQATPSRIDYQWGLTYVDAVRILVPRSLYPQKQTVNLDTVIGNQVFDCDAFGACGVPPGLIAESYLNFGVPGVLLLAIAAGAFVGMLDRRHRLGRRSVAFDLFYIYALVYSGMAILGSGVSGLITQFITQGFSLAIVLAVAKRSSKSRRRSILSPLPT
jgi:oligosaccharide repeat unit polymerase